MSELLNSMSKSKGIEVTFAHSELRREFLKPLQQKSTSFKRKDLSGSGKYNLCFSKIVISFANDYTVSSVEQSLILVG